MAEASTMACGPISRSDHPAPVEMSPTVDEFDILNDDVLIEVAPDRPCGTIRVKLVYAGRSMPIPADEPWAECRGRYGCRGLPVVSHRAWDGPCAR